MLDKCLYVDFSRLSLKKITYKHLSAHQNPLAGFLFRSLSDESRPIVCAIALQTKKRELALSTHRTYHTDHQYILALNFHNNETAYDQYAHTRHPARPYDCHPHR